MERPSVFILGLYVALCCGFTVAQENPLPLPGPGLDLPVDVDGDGASSYGDRFAFNLWLVQGGSLGNALISGEVGNGVLDLSDFFSGPDASLSADAPIAVGGAMAAGGGGAQQGPCAVEFTRRIPPGVVPQGGISEDARVTPDGRFIVFSSRADLGFGGVVNLGGVGFFSQIYRVEFTQQGTAVIDHVTKDSVMGTGDSLHPSISDDG